jgi:hypothetical protein
MFLLFGWLDFTKAYLAAILICARFGCLAKGVFGLGAFLVFSLASETPLVILSMYSICGARLFGRNRSSSSSHMCFLGNSRQIFTQAYLAWLPG